MQFNLPLVIQFTLSFKKLSFLTDDVKNQRCYLLTIQQIEKSCYMSKNQGAVFMH